MVNTVNNYLSPWIITNISKSFFKKNVNNLFIIKHHYYKNVIIFITKVNNKTLLINN